MKTGGGAVPVQVRDAVVEDATPLAVLWRDLASHTAADLAGESPEVVTAKAVLRAAEDDNSRIMVAELDGIVVGCAFLRVGVVSPLDEAKVVHLSHVQVAPGFGRQGIGSALVEGTLTWAEHRGVDTVMTAVPVNDRESNRFLARLGLTQVAALRGASVAALRLRLPHDPSAVARNGGRNGARNGRSVGQVVAARRSQRQARSRQAVR